MQLEESLAECWAEFKVITFFFSLFILDTYKFLQKRMDRDERRNDIEQASGTDSGKIK